MFDAIPISVGTDMKPEFESCEWGLEEVGVVDENRCAVNVEILGGFT
jgi:hypothetical protein